MPRAAPACTADPQHPQPQHPDPCTLTPGPFEGARSQAERLLAALRAVTKLPAAFPRGRGPVRIAGDPRSDGFRTQPRAVVCQVFALRSSLEALCSVPAASAGDLAAKNFSQVVP